MEIGGEQHEQQKSFKELVVVLVISVLSIFLALVFQFRSTTKPLVVFAAIPFGVVAALLSLRVMGAPFGFMAFLGIISLIGVIVSHVIVLFDFIEEEHERGAPLSEALIDAGIMRLRPGARDGGRDGARAGAARGARRPALGAAVLGADRRPQLRDGRHARHRAHPVRHLRARPEAHPLGEGTPRTTSPTPAPSPSSPRAELAAAE